METILEIAGAVALLSVLASGFNWVREKRQERQARLDRMYQQALHRISRDEEEDFKRGEPNGHG